MVLQALPYVKNLSSVRIQPHRRRSPAERGTEGVRWVDNERDADLTSAA
jgi:hypothetical protein